MKRMSIAESTLKKQIDLLYEKSKDVGYEIALLVEQQRVYQMMITDLETEQSRLRTQRTTASERVNP